MITGNTIVDGVAASNFGDYLHLNAKDSEAARNAAGLAMHDTTSSGFRKGIVTVVSMHCCWYFGLTPATCWGPCRVPF